MGYYRIADFKVMVYGEEDYPYIKTRLSEYSCEPFENADTTIRLEDAEFIRLPSGKEPMAKSFMLRRYYADSDSYDIYVVEREENGACSQIHSNLSWSEITVITSSIHITGIDLDFFAFQVMWDAVRNFISYNGGIVLHSSAISYKNQGILFSAPSGTGKSTHTQLWMKLYPESVSLVNDDTPAVFFKDGIPYMYGIPWSGKGENNDIAVPVRAIVFLRRGVQNVIKPADLDSAVFYLLEQTFQSVYPDVLDKTFEKIELLIKSTDIYVLDANMEDTAAETVRQAVFGS